MKISRLSPRYTNELIETADAIDALLQTHGERDDVKTLQKMLKSVEKYLRFMVTDNERFMNS